MWRVFNQNNQSQWTGKNSLKPNGRRMAFSTNCITRGNRGFFFSQGFFFCFIKLISTCRLRTLLFPANFSGDKSHWNSWHAWEISGGLGFVSWISAREFWCLQGRAFNVHSVRNEKLQFTLVSRTMNSLIMNGYFRLCGNKSNPCGILRQNLWRSMGSWWAEDANN